MTPRASTTPLRQLATSQPMFRATARAMRQIPNAIEKITDRLRCPGRSTLLP